MAGRHRKSLLGRWWDFIGATESRSFPEISLGEYLSYLGSSYFIGGPQQTLVGREELPARGFPGYSAQMFGGNAVVFACMALRLRVFSEARFAYRRLRSGRPGDLFSTPDPSGVAMLEEPWPGGTTGDLLARCITSADLGGNAFVRRAGGRLQVLRPDWVTIISGVPDDDDGTGWSLGAEVLGYFYQPGGPSQGRDLEFLFADEVAHFAPVPDPLSPWRGMSWLTPVIREVMADGAATVHKLKFFEKGATPNMIVKADPSLTPERFKEFVKIIREGHEGLEHAYETLFLGGGADATVVGSNLRQLDFKATQGAGETRIAAAAGTPPVLVGLSEGLQAATYSNYGQARRAFADETMRPTWRNFAGSISRVLSVPGDAEVWYDDRDVPFLAEDVKDAAEIRQIEAATIRQLIDGGFAPDNVVDAVVSGDLRRLKHTGLLSVQLQEPGAKAAEPATETEPTDEGEPSSNGQVGTPTQGGT